jgi:hypothetical protein
MRQARNNTVSAGNTVSENSCGSRREVIGGPVITPTRNNRMIKIDISQGGNNRWTAGIYITQA